jgi:hypothetical protein
LNQGDALSEELEENESEEHKDEEICILLFLLIIEWEEVRIETVQSYYEYID